MIRTDLHIHSCLSPCGSDEMTPFDLVGLAKVCGLDLIALTDHNSAKNCPAAAAAAREYGIGFIPGMELNTSEEIHCVCLFPDLDRAMAFDRFFEDHLPFIANRPEIFGNQIILRPDGSADREEKLLITASDISIMELPAVIRDFDGLCWPAHVDRESNGLFAMLGTWPEDLDVPAAEIRFMQPEGIPAGLKIIRASDAHYMEQLMEAGFDMPLASADFAGLRDYILS